MMMNLAILDWPWRRGRSIRFWTNRFSNFSTVVKDYNDMDAEVASAVLKASASVVSIITRTGPEMLFMGSGTIIEYDQQKGIATVLTSMTLVRSSPSEASIAPDLKIEVYLSDGKSYEGELSIYDFYYNIATVTIKSSTPLSTPHIRYIDDSGGMCLREALLVKHSTRFKLSPGDLVIALGRDCENAHEIMASPGVFSARDCRHGCKELFLTSCVVTKLAIGGPLVNSGGEIIGVNFFICPYNTFIPMNMVLKCLEDLKRNGKVSRPWLGANIANLYSADLETLDKLYQKFPSVSSGVIVEQVIGSRNIDSRNRKKIPRWTFWSPRDWLKANGVIQYNHKRKWMQRMKSITRKIRGSKTRTIKWQKSPAADAGICPGDVIIKCGEVSVHSHLEFAEALWDKEGKPVELALIRPSVGQKTVTVTVGTFPGMPRWHF